MNLNLLCLYKKKLITKAVTTSQRRVVAYVYVYGIVPLWGKDTVGFFCLGTVITV
jgi:hypothetical protein